MANASEGPDGVLRLDDDFSVVELVADEDSGLRRIVGTSLLYKVNENLQWVTGRENTDFWFHRVFGYIIMLPVAFGLLYLLGVILNKLFITVEETRPAPVAMHPPRVRMAVQADSRAPTRHSVCA